MLQPEGQFQVVVWEVALLQGERPFRRSQGHADDAEQRDAFGESDGLGSVREWHTYADVLREVELVAQLLGSLPESAGIHLDTE